MGNGAEWNDVFDRAEQQGFRKVVATNGHIRFYAPNGRDIVTCGGTPSDWRAIRNFISELKRAGYKDMDDKATTNLGEVIKARAAVASPANEVHGGRMPRGMAQVLILDKLRSGPPDRLYTVKDLGDVVKSRYPDCGDSTIFNACTTLWNKGKIVKVGMGAYKLAADKSESPPPPGPADFRFKRLGEDPVAGSPQGKSVIVPLPGKGQVALLFPSDMTPGDWDFIKPIIESYITRTLVEGT